jgi:HK97 family phage major capsid protein
MNTNTLEQIRTFKTTTGEYIWKQGLEAGKPDTLLGYPVHEDENMPDIAANSLSIAFGDFQRGYTIVDRNTAMLRDPFTAKPHVLFYTTKRVGAGMRDFRAIKLMKFAAS